MKKNYLNDKFAKNMLIGSMLGDGGIEYSNCRRYPTISITHNGKKEINYINFKYNILNKYYKLLKISHYQNNNTVRFRFSQKEKDIIHEMIDLTRCDDNKRKIPSIDKINEIVLLFWYLDDGSLSIYKQKRKNKKFSVSRKIKISLQSYEDSEILDLINKLNLKFNLNFKAEYYKNKIVSIYINNNINHICDFLDLFKEYKDLIPEEMKYKFCICYHETLQMKDNNFIEYNNCNFHNTGICTCRNIDLSNCYSSSTTK